MPVTSSVTVCSTCTRGFTSMKKCLPCLSTKNSTVPAHRYLAAPVSRNESWKSAWRVASGRPSAGAISTTFWCRRCTEQSRS